jgi:hypothetical protein
MRATRLVVLLAVLGLGTVGACKPLYGGKAEAMKGPPKKKPPPEVAAAEVAIPWNEECDTDFHGKPNAIPPNTAAGKALTETATNTLVQAERNQDPKQRASLTVEAIDKYKAALGKDPYSAEATYGLAVAYTKVLRKGCTLKLLKRLSDLKNNPKFASDAQRMIDAAADQNAFKPFKKDAASALGI